MYRVAIIVNENEALHSVYANSERVIRKALQKVYPHNANDLYSFEVFDKFNIFTLFEKGLNNIFSFDSIFIATNACNNIEVYEELTKHSDIIATYIDDGKGNHHGICISNQQKLGEKYEEAKQVAFLPDNLSYRLIKRDEKKSSDGEVRIANEIDWIVNFPIKITDDVVQKRCSGVENQFMPHNYRFILEPINSSSYEVVYYDKTYIHKDAHFPDGRFLLLKSRIANERVVISSIILDWAEHLEQLADIIVFITEGLNQIAFVDNSKPGEKDTIFEQYIAKAYNYKIALKQYSGKEAVLKVLEGVHHNIIYSQEVPNGKQFYPHVTFVFASSWDKKEVDNLWKKFVASAKSDLVFYRFEYNQECGKDELIVHSSFSKSIKNSEMFLNAIEWLSANFITKKWRKSIWTYEYILDLYYHLSITSTGFIAPIFDEIRTHYKIQSYKPSDEKDYIDLDKVFHPELFEGRTFQSYDNVFNSTCSCCNVIYKLYLLCQINSIEQLPINNKLEPASLLIDERNRFGNWIIYKLNNHDYSKLVSWQDRIMAIVALHESGYTDYVRANDQPIYNLIQKQIQECNKLLEHFFIHTSRGYMNVSSSINYNDICKLLKYAFASMNYTTIDETITQLDAIEAFLHDTQQYNGMWENLSKTSEIALALLYRNRFTDNILISDTFRQITNNAINCIQSFFDYNACCWLNDENTTAKSLTAIYEYGLVFSYTFNDFLIGLSDTSNKYVQSGNVSNNIKAIDYAQKLNNDLIFQKCKQDSNIANYKKEATANKKLIKMYKFIVGLIATAEALTLLFTVCLLGVLVSSYNVILKKIISDNFTIFLSTSLGLIVTTILTGIAHHVKKKLIEDYQKESD